MSSSNDSSRSRRASSRARRLTGIALLLACGAFLAVGVGLFPQEPLRSLVERRLQQALGPGAQLRRFHVVPFRLSAEAEGLRVEAQDMVVSVKRIEVRVAPETLLGRTIALRHLAIVEPRVEIRLTAREAKAKPAAINLPPLRVEQVTLRDGVVVVAGADGSTLARIEGLGASGSIGQGSLEVAADRIETPYAPTASLRSVLRVSPQVDLEIEVAELRTRSSRIRATGRWPRLLSSPPTRLDLDAHLDLAELAPTHGVQAKGRLVLSGTLREGQDAENRRITLQAHNEGTIEAAGVVLQQIALELTQTSTSESRFRGTLRAADGGTLVAEGTFADGNVEATLRADRLSPAVWPEELGLPRTARADAVVRVNGPIEDLHASLRATARMPLPQGRAELSVDVRGTIRPTEREVDVAWSTRGRFAGEGEAPVVREASLLAQGSARGAWPPLVEGRINVDAQVVTPGGVQPISLLGGVHASAESLDLVLTGSGLAGELEARVDVGGSRIREAHVHIEGVDLSRIDPALAGRLTIEGNAEGPLRQPRHSVVIDGRGMAWRGTSLGPVIGRTSGTGGQGELDLALPGLGVVATGTWTPARYTLALQLDGTPLDPLSVLAGSPLTGSIRARLDAEGPLAALRRATARLHVDSFTVTRDQIRLDLTQPWDATLEDERVVVDPLHLAGPGATVQVQGVLSLGEAIGLDLQTKVVASFDDLPTPEGWYLAGTVAGDTSITGTTVAPNLDGALQWTDVAVIGPGVPPLDIRDGIVQLQGRSIRVPELAIGVASGQVEASASIPLAALTGPLPSETESEATASVRWRGVDLAEVLATLSTEPPAARGTLQGEIDARVPVTDLEAVEATLRVPETPLDLGGTRVSLEPAQVTLRRRMLSTEGLVLTSHGARLRSWGQVDLGAGRLALRGEGNLDLRTLSSFLTDTALSGQAHLDLSVTGTLDAPDPRGVVRVENALVRTRSFPQPISGINGRLELADQMLVLKDTTARLGGGHLSATGQARLVGSSVEGVVVDLKGEDLALQYPEGLRSRLDLDLRLRGRGGDLRLAGDVRVERGIYTLDLATEKTFMAAVPEIVASPALRAVRLDVGINLERPVRVDNDVARLAADGRLDLRGTLEWPEPYGRLDIVTPGARLFLQGRVFEVQEGGMVYDGSWIPHIDLIATTPILVTPELQAPFETMVRVEAHGTSPQLTEAWLARLAGSSDPALDAYMTLSSSANLTPRELASYLSTGRGDVRGQEAQAVGEQAATLLANRLAGLTLGSLGLDEVRLQPELVSREQDPGARFTFAKQLGPYLRAVYSQGLGKTEASFFQLQGRPLATTQASVTRTEEGTYVYGVGQRFSIGGPSIESAKETREEQVTLDAVDILGLVPLPDETVRRTLKLRRGREATVWAVQDAGERLRARLVKEGYIEAQVQSDLVDAAATFRVDSGPRFRTEVSGMSAPPDLRTAMTKALFEEEAIENVRAALLRSLRRQGYLRASVTAAVRGDDRERVLQFKVDRGERSTDAQLTFTGASTFSAGRLRSVCGGVGGALEDPQGCRNGIEGLYHQSHYLQAVAQQPRVEERGRAIRVDVPVSEGPRALIRDVEVTGLESEPDRERVRGLLDLAGRSYADATLIQAIQRVRSHYLDQGYAQVRVLPSLRAHEGHYAITVEVAPGERLTIESIEVEGVSEAKASQLREHSKLEVGEPLDPRRLARAERNLAQRGDLARVTVASIPATPSAVRIVATPSAWTQLGYDLRYDTEDDLTGLVDGELRRLPLGMVLGARHRRGGRIAETRGSLFVPGMGGRGLTAVGFYLDEDLSIEGDEDLGIEPTTVIRTQVGGQLQQSWSLGRSRSLLGGYELQRVQVADLAPVRVAKLTLSLLEDTRDNPIDAHRGRFWSLNVDLADGRLASDTSYVKGFAQLFTNHRLSSGLQWSQGLRLGLAHVFDEGGLLVSSERFRAGGANSVRGFATDAIGPLDLLGNTGRGGQAVFVINQEIRYRHPSGLGVVGFYDLGNVFETVKDMRLDARHALGLGLRYESPIGLVRLDWGFPLSRREGEERSQWFVSLGQAF